MADKALPLLIAYRATLRDLETALHKQKTASATLSFKRELHDLAMCLQDAPQSTLTTSPSKFKAADLEYMPERDQLSTPLRPSNVTFNAQDDWFETPLKRSAHSPLMQTLRASDLRASESSHQGRTAKPRGTPVKESLEFDNESIGRLRQEGLTIDQLLNSPMRRSRLYLPVQEISGSFFTLDSSLALSTGRTSSGLFTLYSSGHDALKHLSADLKSPAILEVSVEGPVLEASAGAFLSASVTPVRPILLPRLS
jgi:hypothetical protein